MDDQNKIVEDAKAAAARLAEQEAANAADTSRSTLHRGPQTVGEWLKLPSVRENDPLLFKDTMTDPEPYTEAECLLCVKKFEVMPSTGLIDPVCPECWKTYKDCALVVCSKCRGIIGRVTPKVLENGYTVRPRQVLHVDGCANCTVLATELGHPKAVIVEIKKWEDEQRPAKTVVFGQGAGKLGHPFAKTVKPKPVK